MKYRDEEYFKGLDDHIRNWELLTDDFLGQNVDDKDFFIFEESIDKVIQVFFWDA